MFDNNEYINRIFAIDQKILGLKASDYEVRKELAQCDLAIEDSVYYSPKPTRKMATGEKPTLAHMRMRQKLEPSYLALQDKLNALELDERLLQAERQLLHSRVMENRLAARLEAARLEQSPDGLHN